MPDLALSRRRLLRLAAIGASSLAAPALIGRASGQAPSWSAGNPFTLGVASGTPSPDGFVIWTRLAPDPLSPDSASPGGMPPESVPIVYEVASDEAVRDVVQRGRALAEPSYAHTVHVEVTGLAPGRPYWYRFSSGSAQSPIGQALTLPASDADRSV